MPESPLDLLSLIPDWSKLSEPSTPAGMSAGIVTFLLVIFFAGLAYATYKFIRSRQVVSSLQSLLEGVERDNLASRRREIKQAAENLDSCGNLWREFDESLVLVESSNRLFNTIDAAHFFNTYSLARGLTENRLLAAMPGILTAFGVIGTFAGLQMGLSSLSASVLDDSVTNTSAAEVEALKTGIFAMIAGASVAFTTSLWGVALSVSFNFFEKFLERFIRSNIAALQNQIDYLFPRMTAEQCLVNIEDSTLVSKEKLGELDEKIGNRLQEAMSQATNSIKEGISQSLNDVLAPAISQLVDGAQSGSERAFDSLVNEFMSKMGTAGERQQEAMNQTAGAMRSASSEITEGVGGLVEKLEAVLASNDVTVKSFESVAQANTAAVSELKITTENLGSAAKSLESHTEGFSKTSDALESAVSASAVQVADAAKMLEGVNLAHKSSIDRLQEIYGAISDLHARLQTVGGNADESISSAQRQLAELMEVVKGQMTSFESRLTQFSDTQQTTLDETTKAMSQASSGVTERVEALLERVNSTLTTSVDSVESFTHVANANSSAAAQLKSVADTMASSASDLAAHKQAIASATMTLNHTTTQAGERIKEAADALSNVSTTQSDALARVNDTTESIQRVAEQLVLAGSKADEGLDKVNAHFDRVAQSMQSHIEDLETQLSKLLRDYADEVQTQTTDRLNSWNSQTNEYISAMSDAVGALASVVDDIETKTAVRRAN